MLLPCVCVVLTNTPFPFSTPKPTCHTLQGFEVGGGYTGKRTGTERGDEVCRRTRPRGSVFSTVFEGLWQAVKPTFRIGTVIRGGRIIVQPFGDIVRLFNSFTITTNSIKNTWNCLCGFLTECEKRILTNHTALFV